ncbi:MAG TPA: hypothetical protein DEP46_00920, partial [Blastocatellia bacterium]|nr:hypothetical protein [Blastocatellia bacterium]
FQDDTRRRFRGHGEAFASVIPHHSGAILMCDNPRLEYPEILRLCGEIIESHKREIDQMNRILERK